MPTPRTWTSVNREQAIALVKKITREGGLLVQKPLFGAQGKGLRLITSPADLAAPEEVNGVYYLQEFIRPRVEGSHRDWRLFVLGSRVVAAIIRHGSSCITNINQGARPEAAIPDQDLISLALRATASVGADYAGVDIIEAPEGGYLVLEVNSMPAWNGLQQVTRTRIADQLVAAFLQDALGEPRSEGQEGA